MIEEKLKRLADQYLVGFNISSAAKEINVTDGTAAKYLKREDVKSYMAEQAKMLTYKRQITVDRVLEEYRRIAFGDFRELYDELGNLKEIFEMTEEQQAMIAGIEVEELTERFLGSTIKIGELKKLKRYDKLTALDALARYLGMFREDNEQKKMVIAVKIG